MNAFYIIDMLKMQYLQASTCTACFCACWVHAICVLSTQALSGWEFPGYWQQSAQGLKPGTSDGRLSIEFLRFDLQNCKAYCCECTRKGFKFRACNGNTVNLNYTLKTPVQ